MQKFFIFIFLAIFSQTQTQDVFQKNNLTAWCIVPFDNQHRNPEQRMEMLNELGFQQYVYDWRVEHLQSFETEIKEAQSHQIKMEGVWLWVDSKSAKLSDDNLKIIDLVAKNKLKTTFWVGFNNNFFAGLSHSDKVKHGADFLIYLQKEIAKTGGKIALYNHGDWFGEPENQIEIIKKSGLKDVGIVYSFHHGHHQINRFHSMLMNMLPYLVAINLNGMDISKSQILDLGAGKYEDEMLQMIAKSGFKGRIGLIGHRDQEDVAEVLKKNMEGLEKLRASF